MLDRYEIAWIIWCYQQGYKTAEDRAILHNWLRDDDSVLTKIDIKQRDDCLSMADLFIILAEENEQTILGYKIENKIYHPDDVIVYHRPLTISTSRIGRLKSGNYQFGHGSKHKGGGSKACPRSKHHHHDNFCDLPTPEELLEAGLDPIVFKVESRR